MTPQFAQAVDPVFLAMLDLLEQIQQRQPLSPQSERFRLTTAIDLAEASTSGAEWELAKYALVSWIDELLVETDWVGRDWWSNNVLEVQYFNTRLCNERFYVRAQEAAAQPRRDALEVFYNCVVLGFRGVYRDPGLAEALTPALGLPPDLMTWTRQTALAIRLGQGRAPLPRPRREIVGVPPRKNRSRIVWFVAAAAVLLVLNAVWLLKSVVPLGG
ncbi:MAG: DotU family type IV/VI secretion system protein [Planctomycetota bacterium]|nr:DotU family type IV/VI secretion system protein [Planctomycetota bacterium]